jgi:23S rRNA pseudouridine2605 synthase
MSGKEILHRINQCLVGYSRRQADKIIQDGKVKINGEKIAALGDKIKPGDVVTIYNKKIDWESYVQNQFKASLDTDTPQSAGATDSQPQQTHLYLKLWKQKNIVCTTSYLEENNIIQAYKLDKTFRNHRLFPVGRLDKDSTGLILLTSDASFQHLLTDAKQSVPFKKVYEVGISDKVPIKVLNEWREGLELKVPISRGNESHEVILETKPATINRIHEPDYHVARSPNHHFRRPYYYEMILEEGKNRQIRRIVQDKGFHVTSLHRINYGGISLNGLIPGRWKMLTNEELNLLRGIIQTKSLEKEVKKQTATN